MSVVIVGVGQTAFTTASGVTDAELATEAITAALDDAGLDFTDVDGLAAYEVDRIDPLQLSNELALGELTWFSRTPYGGGMPGAVIQDAVLALEAGIAEVVVAYRAGNMRSGARFGRPEQSATARGLSEWTSPFGVLTPAQRVAPWLHRYMHERGVTNRDMAVVSLTQREYAAVNPNAHFYGRPLTLDDHQASRWVVEPVLRVADCCLETDGGVAFVLTDDARAREVTKRVHVRATARGMAAGSSILANYYHEAGDELPDLRVVARQLWKQSDLGPADMQLGIFYDAFAPYIPMSLEELGFAPRGQGVDFVRSGQTTLDGTLPVNTNGGQLAEAYIHGFNGIAEAVRQIRGTAVNQVPQVVNALVIGSPTLPSSGLVLSSERP